MESVENFRRKIEGVVDSQATLQAEIAESFPPGAEGITEALRNLAEAVEALRRTGQVLSQEHAELAATRLMVESQLRQYREWFDQSPEAYLSIGLDGNILAANQVAAGWLNEQPEQLVGKPFADYLAEQDRAEFLMLVADATALSVSQTVELALTLPGETPLPLSLRASLYRDESDQITGLICQLRELTEHGSAGSTTPTHSRQISALHAATTALLTTLDLETLLGRIIDAAILAIPVAERGILYLVARETGEIRIRATTGYKDPRIQKFALTRSSDHVTQAVREAKPILIASLPAKPAAAGREGDPQEQTNPSVIIAPMILENQVFGALSLESSQEAAFTEDDLALLVTFAATATAAIRNTQLYAETQRLAITDALTGVYNRRGFNEIGQRELERAFRYNRPLTLVMLDIDNLKQVNDAYGHPAGDQVLRTLVQRCAKNVRSMDILGRYGGDEFMILLPETDLFTASNVAERIRQVVSGTPVQIDDHLIPVSISLGIVKAGTHIPDMNTFLEKADAVLYAAKQKGRNRTEVG
jgi:diguanylate cyclase (GGDEF)-like protein/PAS domain S-box-containing protein